MSSKTKTFEAETKDHEIIQNTPPSYDVEVRTTKKYRITIHEFEGKK